MFYRRRPRLRRPRLKTLMLSLFLPLSLAHASEDRRPVTPARADLGFEPPRSNRGTTTVSPVPGSPEASGRALIAALESASPADGELWLVSVEPGVYDLGETPLVLRPVHVQGSGALQTEIVGFGQSLDPSTFSFHRGVVLGASDAELRELTVRCRNTSELDACIVMANYLASPGLKRVRLLATDRAGRGHWGLRNQASSPVLDEVEILVAYGQNNYAVVNVSPSSLPEIRRSSLIARDGSGHNVGVLNKAGAAPELREVEVRAIDGDLAAGVWSVEPQLEPSPLAIKMVDVDIEARDAYESFGVLGGAYAFEIVSSQVAVDRGSAIDVGPYGGVEVEGSEIVATDLLARAGEVRIFATRVRGGGEVIGYLEETCEEVHTNDGTMNVCP